MRVLLVWDGPATVAERSILARRELVLLEQLAARKIDVSIALCGDPAGMGLLLEQAGVQTHRLRTPLPPSAATMAALPSAAGELRRLFASVRPDLVESTEAMPAIAAGLASIPRRDCVLVYRRQHSIGPARRHLASWLAAHLSQRTIVSSETMRQRAAADDHRDPARIEVATPGSPDPRAVRQQALRAVREANGAGAADRVLLVVSRLRHEKGVDVLIRALQRLPDREAVHLWIAGDGPEEAALRHLALRSAVPIHFLGHRDDVGVLLHAADVVVIPSRSESFGRVTLEAMARGRPIVASRTGGLAEAIVDGETGLLVLPADELALASAIGVMLGNRTVAEAFGVAAGNRFRSTYTMSHMAESRIDAWQRCLAAEGRFH